jgi:hypothetical protein
MSPHSHCQFTFKFKDLEVNPAGDRKCDVAHGNPAQCGAFQRPEVRMAMDYEIGQSPIKDRTKLAVPEHPVLGKWLAAECGGGRREVEHGDAHVGVQGEKGPFERLTLPASPNGQPLESPGVNRVRAFMWPESSAAAGRAGDAEASSIRQAVHGGTTVEYFDPRAFEHPPERYPAERTQVVVAEHSDDRQSGDRQELAGYLGFEQSTILREVARD